MAGVRLRIVVKLTFKQAGGVIRAARARSEADHHVWARQPPCPPSCQEFYWTCPRGAVIFTGRVEQVVLILALHVRGESKI